MKIKFKIILLLAILILGIGCVSQTRSFMMDDGNWSVVLGDVTKEKIKLLRQEFSRFPPTGKGYFEGGSFSWDEKGFTVFIKR